MSKIFFLLVLLILCAVSTAAQNKKQFLSVDNEIIKIQKSAGQFRVKTSELPEISSEGATTKGFYDRNQIRKTAIEIFGEMGKVSAEFFYQNGKLIYVSRKELSYDQTFGKVIKTNRQKLYFANDKLIRLIDNGKSVSKATAKFTEQEQQTLELANKILDSFKASS